MYTVYLYDGPFERGEAGWPLIRAAAARHGAEAGLPVDFTQAEILREEKGKPYFVETPLEFSLSHSGLLWICMFADRPCGIDLQRVKDCGYEDIAKRQFTEDEQHYVRIWGIDGFFRLWVRKEAFCKCTGQGIFSQMPSMVSGEMELLDEISWQGRNYYLTDLEIADDIQCAACTVEKAEIQWRVLA